MPKFAANLTWMFNECEFPERFAFAAKLGFRAVECQFPYDWDRELLAQRLSASKLRQVMFNMPPGDMESGEYGLAGLPGREQQFQDSVATALAYADALDCTMLHMLAGIVPADQCRQKYLETYIQNLEWAAKECARSGVTVLLEPINTFERPGYLISTTSEARYVIEQIESANVAMQFDVHNAQLMEGNLSRALRSNFSNIGHIQIAGVPDRTPPDVGEINYPYLFDLIDELGYTGWVGCEFRPGERTVDGLVWAARYGIGS